MNRFGLVSIIMPNYNKGKFIIEAIESVMNQDYQNWELLIQDDCSNDDSYNFALEFSKKDSRISLERNKHRLFGAATRNRAIERSSGEWLAFLDSDDVWLSNKLSFQLNWMKSHNVDFSFTEYCFIDKYGNTKGITANVIPRIDYKGMMRAYWPGCLTVIYKQDINNKIYSPDIHRNNDMSLLLRAIKDRIAYGIPQITALYRIHDNRLSSNKFQILCAYIKVIHEFEGQSIFYAYFCVFSHVFYKLFRKYRKKK